MLVLESILGIVFGLAGHFVFYDLTARLPSPDIYRYGIGVVLAWPIFSLMRRKRDDCNLLFIVSFAMVGAGVVLGRILRMTSGKSKNV